MFRRSSPISLSGIVNLRVLPSDVDIKKVNIDRFFALGDLGWAALLMDWGVFISLLSGRYSAYGKCLSLSVRSPLWLFQKFEVRTTIIWADKYWVNAEQHFVARNTVVAVSFIKGALLEKDNLMEVARWAPKCAQHIGGQKPVIVEMYQRVEREMWRSAKQR